MKVSLIILIVFLSVSLSQSQYLRTSTTPPYEHLTVPITPIIADKEPTTVPTIGYETSKPTLIPDTDILNFKCYCSSFRNKKNVSVILGINGEILYDSPSLCSCVNKTDILNEEL
jgi:hypothetical protein